MLLISVKRVVMLVVILAVFFTMLILVQTNQIEELRHVISRQELEMKEKQNVINSYARGYIEQCECNCSLYEEFYFKYFDKVDVYE